MNRQANIGKTFLATALVLLLVALAGGLLASFIYIRPDFLKTAGGFSMLRPLHVSAAMFWILLAATGGVLVSLQSLTGKKLPSLANQQYTLWIIAIGGIFYSYLSGQFGGREYWEFPPFWALIIACAWLLFIYNFISLARTIRKWPVYVWMWLTGVVFFLFSFTENYLWLFPYFREHFVTDMTIQWKVNGSLVGAWNQLIYGTAFFLMDRISGNKKAGHSPLAFAMYFLGLFNLMFNWGHHIYTLPTDNYVRYLGYFVSMTEWIIFARIVYTWRKSVTEIQKHYHYFPYRFLMASDIWVFINIGQALMMSIPAINIYTHGTHVTVAHAMGTTIGINTMILLAVCFEFLGECYGAEKAGKLMRTMFWTVQSALLVFWLALNGAGVQKAIWQMSEQQMPFSQMMDGLRPWLFVFIAAGAVLLFSLSTIATHLLSFHLRCYFNARKKIITLSHTPLKTAA